VKFLDSPDPEMGNRSAIIYIYKNVVIGSATIKYIVGHCRFLTVVTSRKLGKTEMLFDTSVVK